MTNRFTKKQVFFDLDDTLIDEGYRFELAFCEWLRVIILAFETRSPSIDEILQRARTIDNQNLNTVPSHEKYLPQRFVKSWITCYRELCEENGHEPKKHVEDLLEAMIIQTYDPPYFIIPGAIEVLNELVRYGRYELHLMTAGGMDIQRRKVEVTDIGKYFSTIHYLPDGNKGKVLADAVQQFGKDYVASVGNSIRTDINPAIELGVHGIYIPRGTWNYLKVDPISNDFVTIDSINKVPDALDQWAKATLAPENL